jgi:hypothetical protein
MYLLLLLRCAHYVALLRVLVAGFTLSTLTQVPVLDSHSHVFWQYLFWISCAIVMVSALVNEALHACNLTRCCSLLNLWH